MTTNNAEKKLNPVQADRWVWLLAAFATAKTQRNVARAMVRIEGYLLGLLDAQVISEQERDALYQQAKAPEMEAAHRTADTASPASKAAQIELDDAERHN